MTKVSTNDYYVALECKDLQANAMSVDSTGTFVLLAGRRNIALRNLNEEYDHVYKFPRQSKYEVSAAEWNPHHHNKELCVISSNERLEVLVWRNESLTQTHALRAHTRVITDINWNKFKPDLLASSSVDTYIHIWDLHDSRRPVISLSAIAEASQVRWNRKNEHLIATAHEGDIKIWDTRKASAPVHYIAAHVAKIYGLDWSYTNENQIASSSQDSTVKFFDITNPRKAEIVLATNSPVWRARYTPFGNGLITAVVPLLSQRRGENSLLFWNIANHATPMHTFVGHRDVVLEFQWRHIKANCLNHQLVTWSKDQTLLVWTIKPFLQKLCGGETEDYTDFDEGDMLISDSFKVSQPLMKKQLLHQEFSLLNVRIPNVEVKKMDADTRNVVVTCRMSNFTLNMQVVFPDGYPYGIAPVFHILPKSTINEIKGAQVILALNYLAQQRVLKNRTCLEPCLRHMVSTLEQFQSDVDKDRTFERMYTEPANSLGNYNDAYIPFPKTSGAKFSSVSTLVCFGRPRRLGTKNECTGTPRSLSALEPVPTKHSNLHHNSLSAFYYQGQKQRTKSKHTLSKSAKSMVHVYDTSMLFFMNLQLAEEYIVDGYMATVCKHNAAAAAVVGRRDLVQAWTLAELVMSQIEDDSGHPFGNKVIKSLIQHYASQNDVQMAAMLCCVCGKEKPKSFTQLVCNLFPPSLVNSEPNYHTIPPADIVADGWVLPAILKQVRSTSLDNLRTERAVIAPLMQPSENTYVALYEYYKMAYAETLHRWGLLYNRAEVMKYMCSPIEHKSERSSVEFFSDCDNCLSQVKNSACRTCKKWPLHCMICNISVKGSMICCLICGHGGHTEHLEEWYKLKDMCAKCGCKCLFETSALVGS